MTQFKEVEFFLVWNERGDILGDTDLDSILETFEENYGGHTRHVHSLKLRVPVSGLPSTQIDLPSPASVETL
jgi:hypothetical protein